MFVTDSNEETDNCVRPDPANTSDLGNRKVTPLSITSFKLHKNKLKIYDPHTDVPTGRLLSVEVTVFVSVVTVTRL